MTTLSSTRRSLPSDATAAAAVTPLDWDQVADEVAGAATVPAHPLGYVLQAGASVQAVDRGQLEATFVIVTRSVEPNRQGNRLQLLPGPRGAGLRQEHYARNPVVLYDHGLSGVTLPIGLSISPPGGLPVQLTETSATATVRFSQQRHAEPIFAAVAEGLLRMASIGFQPVKLQRLRPAIPTRQAIADPGSLPSGFEFTEADLLEWSIVPVGADPQALRQAIDRGRIHDVRLPPWLRQAWQVAVGPRSVTVPGWSGSDQQAAESGAVEQRVSGPPRSSFVQTITQTVTSELEPLCAQQQQLERRLEWLLGRSPR